MTFQNLKQLQRVVRFNDGTIIKCSSCFGQDTVNVFVPPVISLPIEKRVEEVITEKPADMWFRNPNDNTVWSYTKNMDKWEQIGTTPAGSDYPWTSSVWTGSVLITFLNRPYENQGLWQFDGKQWTQLTFGQAPYVYSISSLVRALVWTGTEILLMGGYTGTTIYLHKLVAYNPTTDTWRLVASKDDAWVCYGDPELIYPNFINPCWDGTGMYSVMTRVYRSGEYLAACNWAYYSEGTGKHCGASLPIEGEKGWSIVSFISLYSRLVWNGVAAIGVGEPYWWPSDPGYSQHPVIANNGLDNYSIVHPGPGFTWTPLFWTGTELWATDSSALWVTDSSAEDSETGALWKFVNDTWIKISKGPGFIWGRNYSSSAVYTGKLKSDGTPV